MIFLSSLTLWRFRETLVDCIAQEKGIPLSHVTHFKEYLMMGAKLFTQLFTIEKNYVIVNS